VFDFYPNFKEVLQLLLDAHLFSQSPNQINDLELCETVQRSLHSVALLRFINYVYENCRSKLETSLSFHADLRAIKIPEWLIDLRNDISHHGLPELSKLIVANQFILNFIKTKCFPEASGVELPENSDNAGNQPLKIDFGFIFEDQSISLVKQNFFQYANICLFISQNKSMQEKEQYGKLKNSIFSSINPNAKPKLKAEILLDILAHRGVICPTYEQMIKINDTLFELEDNSIFALFQKLKTHWDPIISTAANSYENFHLRLMILLVISMRSISKRHPLHHKLICLWLEDIFKQYKDYIEKCQIEVSRLSIVQLLQELLLASSPQIANLLVSLLDYLNKKCLALNLKIDKVFEVYEQTLNTNQKYVMKQVLRAQSKRHISTK
ncbi:MAG: Ribosomal biogenesis protein las1l, partial [Marteilia pararefringens]